MDCPRLARIPGILYLCLGLMALSGCRESGNASVHGMVKYQGEPLPTGTIRFFPDAGGRPAVGQIQPDGSYRLGTKVPGDGAAPGAYSIAIEAIKTTAVGDAPKSLEEEIARGPSRSKVEYLLPPKYGSKQTSELQKTVESGDNEINFDLR